MSVPGGRYAFIVVRFGRHLHPQKLGVKILPVLHSALTLDGAGCDQMIGLDHADEEAAFLVMIRTYLPA